MSHIVQDRIGESWKKLNSAENFMEEERYHKAISVCEDSIKDMVSGCKGFIEDDVDRKPRENYAFKSYES